MASDDLILISQFIKKQLFYKSSPRPDLTPRDIIVSQIKQSRDARNFGKFKVWQKILQRTDLPIDITISTIKELIGAILENPNNNKLHKNWIEIDENPDVHAREFLLARSTGEDRQKCSLTDLAHLHSHGTHPHDNQKQEDLRFYCKLLLCLQENFKLLYSLIKEAEGLSNTRTYLIAAVMRALIIRTYVPGWQNENPISVNVIRKVLPFLEKNLSHPNAKVRAECLWALIVAVAIDKKHLTYLLDKCMDLAMNDPNPHVRSRGYTGFANYWVDSIWDKLARSAIERKDMTASVIVESLRWARYKNWTWVTFDDYLNHQNEHVIYATGRIPPKELEYWDKFTKSLKN